MSRTLLIRSYLLNPLVPNVPFLYPLKTSEKPYGFFMFSRGKEGCIGNEWIKKSLKEGFTFCAVTSGP